MRTAVEAAFRARETISAFHRETARLRTAAQVIGEVRAGGCRAAARSRAVDEVRAGGCRTAARSQVIGEVRAG